MKIVALTPEKWKIDGGVAFGVIPKTLWKKFYHADEDNLIEMSNTCLLIDEGDRKWLIDTGFGNKRDEKYYRFKYIYNCKKWDDVLAECGYKNTDITDILFTHLHDDHCGGSMYRDTENHLQFKFPNARYHIGRAQYESSINPNPREAAAYFKDNISKIIESDKVNWIEEEMPLSENIRIIIRNGHTRGLLIPVIRYGTQTIVYTNDFIPSIAHISPVWIASVDIEPILALREKEIFLVEAVEKHWVLFFGHAPSGAAAKVYKDLKGFAGEELELEKLF